MIMIIIIEIIIVIIIIMIIRGHAVRDSIPPPAGYQ